LQPRRALEAAAEAEAETGIGKPEPRPCAVVVWRRVGKKLEAAP